MICKVQGCAPAVTMTSRQRSRVNQSNTNSSTSTQHQLNTSNTMHVAVLLPQHTCCCRTSMNKSNRQFSLPTHPPCHTFPPLSQLTISQEPPRTRTRFQSRLRLGTVQSTSVSSRRNCASTPPVEFVSVLVGVVVVVVAPPHTHIVHLGLQWLIVWDAEHDFDADGSVVEPLAQLFDCRRHADSVNSNRSAFCVVE